MPAIPDLQGNFATSKFRQYVLQALKIGLPVVLQPDTSVGYQKFHHVSSLATTNDTLVETGSKSIGHVSIMHIGTGNSNRYLKLYNKATAPTSADVPMLTLAVHSGETIVLTPSIPFVFSNGLGYRMTANYADNDNTAVAAGEMAINIIYA